MYCIPDNIFSFMQKSSRFVGRALQYHAVNQAAIMDSQVIDNETDFGDMPETNENDSDIKTKLKISKQVNNESMFSEAKTNKEKVKNDILKSIARLEELQQRGVVNVRKSGTQHESQLQSVAANHI